MPDTLQLSVNGMTCGGCENAVRRALSRIDGVQEVTASHASNQVRVTFDAASVTPAVIRDTIEALGYQVAA